MLSKLLTDPLYLGLLFQSRSLFAEAAYFCVMKRLIILSLFALFAMPVFAQKDSLAFDENNKYIYYQVVEQPGTAADSLFSRAAFFFDKGYPQASLKTMGMTKTTDALSINAAGSFLVSKKSLVTSHEDGSVSFTMHVDVKEGKYRYWLTDFVFNPYQRDRYNNYVSIPGIYIPLEKSEGKIDKKDLTAYLDGVLSSSRKIGTKLKEFMLKNPLIKKEPAVKKISTKDW